MMKRYTRAIVSGILNLVFTFILFRVGATRSSWYIMAFIGGVVFQILMDRAGN